MTRLLLVTIMSAIMLSSCGGADEAPLPRETMVKLMTDIHLSEVYGTMVNDSLHQSINRNMDSVAVYYKSILAHHNVTIEQFKQSLDWYSDHPLELDSVYINIQNEIIQLESTVNNNEE